MKFLILSFFISVTTLATELNLKRPWEGISDPLIMSANFNRNFYQLPLIGGNKHQKNLWSGDYWALNKGNINQRWNTPHPIGHNLKSPTRDEVQRMTPHQLSQLAPTEKFDILNAHYDYPIRRKVERHAYPNASDWEGICHGWAPASINHNEPLPKTLINPDGIEVPFGSADIKALISFYYANEHKVETTHQMGRRCTRGWFGPDRCKHDMNAGAFHIVLANRLGLQGESFVADMDNGKEVWNHPLHSYVSTVLAENLRPNRQSAPGTVQMIKVRTDLKYVLESEKNTWGPILGTELQLYKNVGLEYLLDLNAQGQIIGGDWLTKLRPDFLWLMSRATSFEGDFTGLEALLNDGP